MVCVHCGAKTHVFNSRLQRRNNHVWRRRQCVKCGAVFTTQEVAQYGGSWTVQDASGAFRPFSRDKLLLSLYKSCQHRSKALEDAAELTDTVIRRLSALAENGRLWSGTISQVVSVTLTRFDKAAGVHYQAFHQ
jgi:transcriptional repressor NrdR